MGWGSEGWGGQSAVKMLLMQQAIWTQIFGERVVKLMSQKMSPTQQITCNFSRVFNFLISLNKRAHDHHSADYRGSNYLHLMIVSVSNTAAQIFLWKSHYKWERRYHLTFDFYFDLWIDWWTMQLMPFKQRMENAYACFVCACLQVCVCAHVCVCGRASMLTC